MNIRYRLSKTVGKEVFSNLETEDIKISNKVNNQSQIFEIDSVKVRAGKYNNEHYELLVFSNDADYLCSSKKFKAISNFLLNAADTIHESAEKAREEINKSTNRLIHNLTSLNAHNIQEFYSLVPQDGISKKMSKQIAYVSKIVEEDPKETALTLVKMAKNNTAIKVELSVFKKLFESNPELRSTKHNIHKVLMNVFYLFFPDFTDKEVKVEVKVDDDNKNIQAYFDYESIHVALYHVIENAAKYIKPKSNLVVTIQSSGNNVLVSFDMMSTPIKSSEIDLIFEEGFSGELAHATGKAGSGIGMYRAKKILELNGGMLSVNLVPNTTETILNVDFQKNIFIIELPKTK